MFEEKLDNISIVLLTSLNFFVSICYILADGTFSPPTVFAFRRWPWKVHSSFSSYRWL